MNWGLTQFAPAHERHVAREGSLTGRDVVHLPTRRRAFERLLPYPSLPGAPPTWWREALLISRRTQQIAGSILRNGLPALRELARNSATNYDLTIATAAR